MRKLFKSCGSWNPDSFQITSFQVRTCVLCGWCKSMLALTQIQLERRTRIKNLCLKVRCSPRSKKDYGWLKHQIIIIGGIEELWKKKNKAGFCWNYTKRGSSILFGRIILAKCVWHVALKFSRVDHNAPQLFETSPYKETIRHLVHKNNFINRSSLDPDLNKHLLCLSVSRFPFVFSFLFLSKL